MTLQLKKIINTHNIEEQMKEQAAQHGTHVGASSSDDNDAYLLQLNKRKKKQPKKKLILENYDLQKVYELFGDVGPAAVSPSGLPHGLSFFYFCFFLVFFCFEFLFHFCFRSFSFVLFSNYYVF